MKTGRTLTAILLMAALAASASGCGYTTKSLLSDQYRAIYVDNFKNMINISAEQTNLRMYRGYKPGMEVNMRNAVIEKFLIDGNLKISSEDKADLVLRVNFIDYKREAMSWDTDDNVEQYRIKLVIDMELTDTRTGKVLWAEKGFTGEQDYRTSGGVAMSEGSALALAERDLARRVVERTVEAW